MKQAITRCARLLYGSFVVNEKVSPRLLTVFAFVAVALWQVVYGSLTATWPPSYVWDGEVLLIAGLLGLGKLAETYQKVKTVQAVTESTPNAPGAPAE